VLSGETLPKGLPAQIRRVIATKPTEAWFVDFIANERLHDRMVQNFMEMSVETRVHERELGISGPAKCWDIWWATTASGLLDSVSSSGCAATPS
jgi:hypothetical protein